MESEVSAKLLRYINSNDLKVGDQLPSTLALATEFEETPSKVRTALITLASIGLIEIRPRAGSYIKALDIHIIERLFSILLNQGITDKSQSLLNVYECKTMVDSEIFSAAAKVRTEVELYQLRSIINKQHEQKHSQEGFIICDEEIHGFVATISRNPLFSLLINILQAMLRPDRFHNERYSMTMREEVLNDHEQLYQAIKDQDCRKAREIARKHSNRRTIEILKGI